MEDFLARYRRARAWAVERWPYLGPGLFVLEPRPTPAVRTAAVSREGVLHVNPSWASRLSTSELGAVLVHELAHLLREHHRRSLPPPRRWKAACDLEINDDPDLAAWLPPEGLTPQKCGVPRGLLAEQYHRLLEGAPCLREAVLTLGSGSVGERPSHEDGTRPLGEKDLERVAALVREEILRAGNVPGTWRRWAEGKPRLPAGTDRLAALLERILTAGGTGLRPHRRAPFYRPVLLPAPRRHATVIWVIIDTSASMRPEELDAARRAVNRVAGQRGLALQVIEADARVQRIRRSVRRLGPEFLGGGGTDLVEAVRLALSQRPALVLVVTDGAMQRWPPPSPRVVYALTKHAPIPPGRVGIRLF